MTSATVTAPNAAPARARRLDVQGLRAVASLLVASFHIWVGTVSGGVDVFFAVGGFLLASSLVSEVERRGRVDVLGALRRQALRLFPMAGTVLLVVGVLAVVVLPRTTIGSTALDLFASATYWENWRLAAASTDYVDDSHDQSVVQHFWAMGVQGQVTLAMILLAALVAVVLGARSAERIRRTLGWGLVVVAVVSFVYALVALDLHRAFAYFDTGARAWELALGGAAALLLSRVPWPSAARVVMGIVGLLLLLTAGQLPVTWYQPGPVALWPVIGAILILLAGSGGDGGPVARLLRLRPLVWIGGISYGVYLWHWPILIFARELLLDGARPGPLGGITIIVASIALSWLCSTAFDRIGKRGIRPIVAFAVPIVAIAALVLQVMAPAIQRQAVEEATSAVEVPSSATELERQVSDALVDPPLLADGLGFGEEGRVPEWLVDGCLSVDAANVDACRYGPADADQEVWIVGDSQSVTWAPAVRSAVGDDVAVQLLGRSMCPFSGGEALVAHTGPNFTASCEDHNEWILSLAQERLPDVVFVSNGSWWTGEGYEDRDPDQFQQLADMTIGYAERLQALGVTVVWADSPPPPHDAQAACQVAQDAGSAEPCAMPLTQDQLDRHELFDTAFADAGLTVIDTLSWFCDVEAMACPIVVDGAPVWIDNGHMGNAESQRLAAGLVEPLEAALAGGS